MMKLLTRVAFAVLAIFMVSCMEGPSGPHPGMELSTLYDLPPLTGITVRTSARMLYRVQGDTIGMSSLMMNNDTVLAGQISFSTSRVSPGSTPDLDVKFSSTPSAVGTFSFVAAKVTRDVRNEFVPTSAQGVFVNINGNLYAPVSGTVTITKVSKDANVIFGYSGYITGKLRSLLPRKFVKTNAQPFPPGFDPLNPTLVGDELTLHSVRFETRSNSAVAISS